jgi:hypothetical protein
MRKFGLILALALLFIGCRGEGPAKFQEKLSKFQSLKPGDVFNPEEFNYTHVNPINGEPTDKSLIELQYSNEAEIKYRAYFGSAPYRPNIYYITTDRQNRILSIWKKYSD